MVASEEQGKTRNGHHGRGRSGRSSGRSQKSSERSTANSKKLRKVLQKKQLEELLKSYSSFMDEDHHGNVQHERDLFTLVRKGSIEGNVKPPVTSTDVANHITNEMHMIPDPRVAASIDELDAEERVQRATKDATWTTERQADSDNSISEVAPKPLIKKRSHCHRRRAIEKDSRYKYPPAIGDADSGAAVAGNRGGEQANAGARPTGKPPRPNHRSAKREDFQSRMGEVNAVVRTFSERAQERHRELAEDFQEATLQVRTHFKLGANALFDDLSEQFDELVHTMFLSDEVQQESESRNQDGDSEVRGTIDRHQSSTDHRENTPLSHHEAILLMNRQLSEALEPVTQLTEKVRDQAQQVSCIAPQPEEEKCYMYDSTLASF